MKIYSRPQLVAAIAIWIVLAVAVSFFYANLTYVSLEFLVKSFPLPAYFIGVVLFIVSWALLVGSVSDNVRWGQTPKNLFFLSLVFACLSLLLVPWVFNQAGFVALAFMYVFLIIFLLFLIIAVVGYFFNKKA